MRQAAFISLALALTCLPNCRARATHTEAAPSLSASSAPATRTDAPPASEPVSMPPLEPPSDAQQGPPGVRWQLVSAGQQADVDAASLLGLKLHVFTRAGKVVEGGKTDGSFSVPASRLPAELRQIVGQVGTGGRARFWLEPEATQAWRPQSWPNEALLVDLTLLSVGVVQQSEVALPTPGRLTGISQPPAGGPPADTRLTALKVPFQVLRAAGRERRPTEQAVVQLRFQVWQSSSMAIQQVLPAQANTRPMHKLPQALQQVLSVVSEGDVVRIWLKPEQARELMPTKPSGDVIVDIEVEKVTSA